MYPFLYLFTDLLSLGLFNDASNTSGNSAWNDKTIKNNELKKGGLISGIIPEFDCRN
jgi:hypothetical protein